MKKQPLKILKIDMKWLIAGIIILILGYIILSWSSGTIAHPDNKSTWLQLIVAPFILISGYVCVGVSIFKIKH